MTSGFRSEHFSAVLAVCPLVNFHVCALFVWSAVHVLRVSETDSLIFFPCFLVCAPAVFLLLRLHGRDQLRVLHHARVRRLRLLAHLREAHLQRPQV